MEAAEALAFIDTLIFDRTGDRINDLQRAILHHVWERQKYGIIADTYGYTEGHVKDIAAELWKLLSELLSEKVVKGNLQTVIKRQIGAARESVRLEFEPNHDSVDFVGRSGAISQLQALEHQGARVILIQAQGGVGKTTLARRYLQQEFSECLEFAIARETQNITSVESLVEERLRQLHEEPGREFGISLDRLKRKLQSARIGILIDNLEPVLDVQGKFIQPHRRYVELLEILADPSLKSLTLITSRDRLCEAAINVSHYLLPGLELSAWQYFFSDRDIVINSQILQTMHNAYGGNAKAMEIIKSAIALDFDGDMTIYWQEYGGDPLVHADLADLVTSQFDRLQKLDPDAYRLLCRMGCYRFQDVRSVSTEALLHLLWDVPLPKRRRVVESLRNRSLVEHHCHDYWLHPAIRAEAIARLRASEDIEITNRLAAEFWTARIQMIATVDHALTAFEAYYHYIEISGYENAANVILQRRPTKLSGVERLGRSFYQLGLLQQMMHAIAQIMPKISSGYHLSGLYSIQGVLYRLSGQIHAAIDCHQKSGAIATQELSEIAISTIPNRQDLTFLNLKNWEQHALLNTGICQMELWELDKALAVFEALLTCKRTDLITANLETLFNPSVEVLAAFLYSCLGDTIKASELIEQFDRAMQLQPLSITGHRLLFLGLTYKNLGETSKAQQMFQQAIAYANENHYTQVRANALIGIAEICRSQQDFEQAIAHHHEAIALLEKIGAKCDLAEAHFQLGLTLRLCDQPTASKFNCDRAIQLFDQMSAPKQIEKVKNSQ